MNEAFEQWRQDQDKYNMPTHEETFRAGMLAAAELIENSTFGLRGKLHQHLSGESEMTDERIVQIANEHFMDCNQLTRHQVINFARAILAEAVPQCTHKYEIDSDHPNHSCCQNCGEILKDGVHVQPVAQEYQK